MKKAEPIDLESKEDSERIASELEQALADAQTQRKRATERLTGFYASLEAECAAAQADPEALGQVLERYHGLDRALIEDVLKANKDYNAVIKRHLQRFDDVKRSHQRRGAAKAREAKARKAAARKEK
jgi:DNA repair ATPase RecN